MLDVQISCTLKKVAAMEIYQDMIKPPLTSSPFVCSITIGKQRWILELLPYGNTSQRLHGLFKILFPHYDFIFLFDHSQGHSMKQVGSLQASCVSLKFGGRQPHLQDTKITAGCLRPFPQH